MDAIVNIINTTDWSAVTGLASCIIALCALDLTVRQIRDTMKHNKLSVKPALMDRYARDFQAGTLSLFLTNTGLGPAESVSFKILVGGEPIEGIGQELAHNVLEKIFGSVDVDYQIEKWTTINPGCVFHVQQEQRVFHIRIDSPKLTADFFDRLQTIHVEIEYKSLYGDTFKLNF